jgi:hypothetical protein
VSVSADKLASGPQATPIPVPATAGDDRIFLIQATWPLTSEELGQITRRRSFWSEVGAVLILFATGHLLQFVVKFNEDQANTAAWLNGSSKLGLSILVLGIVLYGIGLLLGGERREILKKIKLQFKSNPGERRRLV